MGPPEGKVLWHTVPDGAGWSAAHPLVTAHSRTARLLKPLLLETSSSKITLQSSLDGSTTMVGKSFLGFELHELN